MYAAGDVCSRFKFTHAADAMARTAIQNALFFGRKRVAALVIPWCTYTDPEVAHVGLLREEAERQGFDVTTYTEPMAGMDRAVLDGETEGFARVHADRRTGRILGATAVSAHAGEMLGEIVLAMTERIGLGRLSSTILPCPKQAGAWKRLGDPYMRSKLTPGRRAMLSRFLRWRR